MARQSNTESSGSPKHASFKGGVATTRRQKQTRERAEVDRDESQAQQSSPRSASKAPEATLTRREERRRERAKAKADKMFARQFAGNSSAKTEAEGQGAPRAALYKGKMGASQRKSARMQRSSTAGGASAKINPLGWLNWFSTLPITERSLKAATAVICVVLVAAFLYAPAQQYYQAQRERDQLAAEYAIISERNTILDEQNDVYASDAGMEDAVRAKYGYVKAGEHTAIVTGLSEHTTDTSRDNEQLEPAVLSSTVKAPEEWYTPFLDAFFGVK